VLLILVLLPAALAASGHWSANNRPGASSGTTGRTPG